MKFSFKTFMSLLIALFFISSNGLCSKTSNQRICVADIQLIFQESDAEKDAKLELEIKQKEMGIVLDKMGKEIEKLNETLKRESIVLNKKIFLEKERDLRIKINDLKALKINFQEELDLLQQKLVTKIEKAIINISARLGKAEGYSLIINKSAALYSDTTIDITQKILSEYNSEYNKQKEKK